jgi:hypothetical protein
VKESEQLIIAYLSRNFFIEQNVHCRVVSTARLILNEIYPLHILTPHFPNIDINAIPTYAFVFQLDPIPLGSPTKMFIHFSLPVRATYSADLNILYLFTLIIFI